MATYTVPVFLGVVADSPEEAVEKTLSFVEYSLEVGNDAEEFPYSDVGAVSEVIKQEE